MSRRRPPVAARALAALTAAAIAGCGGDDTVSGPPPRAPGRVDLRSPAFANGAAIPRRFSCDGDDRSPPLSWARVPATARALALLMEDPDAPGGTFVHWTLYDIPPRTARIREGRAPAGAREGENSFGKRGYGGPCPPQGDQPHRYVFLLYALRSPLELDPGASPDDVRAAIADRAVARGRLMGRFGR